MQLNIVFPVKTLTGQQPNLMKIHPRETLLIFLWRRMSLVYCHLQNFHNNFFTAEGMKNVNQMSMVISIKLLSQ